MPNQIKVYKFLGMYNGEVVTNHNIYARTFVEAFDLWSDRISEMADNDEIYDVDICILEAVYVNGHQRLYEPVTVYDGTVNKVDVTEFEPTLVRVV